MVCREKPTAIVTAPSADPRGPSTGSNRVDRGGSWNGTPLLVRSAFRGRLSPDFRNGSMGFRVLRSSGLSGR
ncbi:SUMF1/EgtB/PvdO family nonheme iron enzyme [bacterium]|nr:SUMF1/EgtB/PvdO family nonheme iron enzyme [bacterium]